MLPRSLVAPWMLAVAGSSAADGNHVLTVTLTDDPMPLIASALGVSYGPPEGDAIFTSDDDTDFASVYPGTSVHCQTITRDATTGACMCADPALR